MAIQRAEDKTAQMQARAGAIDELIASGALDDASSLNRGDDIARELEAMSSQSDVEAELARLKGGVGARRRSRPAGRRRHPRGRAADAEPSPATGEQTVIVRILGEGQYDLSDDAVSALNELDAKVEAADRGRRRGGVPRRARRAARRRTHGRRAARRRARSTPPT